MEVIDLENLRPGMVLKSDVTDRNGRVLLRAGSVVTEKHIEIFQARGVTEADVNDTAEDDVSAAADQEISPEDRQKAEEYIRDRFRLAKPRHAFTDELIRVCISRRAQQLKD